MKTSALSPGVTWHKGTVTNGARVRLLGQRPLTVWLTGLSGSGKSTIAYDLDCALFSRGYKSFVLDGDNLRHGLCGDLGFSQRDRSENIRRVAEVARLMNDAGVIVISAFISPFSIDREVARQIVGESSYFEVYLNTPIQVCEDRDPKGLYQKARQGYIEEFTGVSSPYEAPCNSMLQLDTSVLRREECIDKLIVELIPMITLESNGILSKKGCEPSSRGK